MNKPITGHMNYEEWFESLPFDKQMFVAQHVKKKIDKIHEDTTEIIDSCYIGAMIEEFDMDLDDCIKIAERANINMKITEQILNKEGECYYMRVNNEESRKEIRDVAKAMLKENPKQSTSNMSEQLMKDYTLPKKDLNILVAEARKEIKKEKDIQEEVKVEVFKDGEKVDLEYDWGTKVVNGEGKLVPFEKPKEESKLKIKSIELEGKFGTYFKGMEGVKIGNTLYKDITDLKHAKEVLESNSKAREMQILEELDNLNKELWSLQAKREEELEKYAEIEAAFAM